MPVLPSLCFATLIIPNPAVLTDTPLTSINSTYSRVKGIVVTERHSVVFSTANIAKLRY